MACGDDVPDQVGGSEDTLPPGTDGTTSGATSDTLDSTSADDGPESSDGSTGGGYLDDPQWPNLECDPLVPEYCGYPFPNNVFTVVDEDSITGRRLALSTALLPRPVDPSAQSTAAYDERDGFSCSATLLAHLPGATADGLPDPGHIEDSIEPTSPTIVLDADTGELFAHFAEVDVNADGEHDRSLMIQPAASLEYGHRYIVALRGVVDASGTPVEPSPAFAALRDGTDSDEPSVDERRALYDDIFARLQDVGVDRGDLQLAWDFTVASREDTNGRLVHMRDVALDMAGAAGPTYEILDVTDEPAPGIFRRIEGEIEVPLFLDIPGPGGVLQVEDGVPTPNGTARYPFLLQIPASALGAPAPVMLIGHGQFGSRYEAEAPFFQAFASEANIALLSLDWIGMSSQDPTFIALAVSSGDASQLRIIPDRLQQSLVNFLSAARMARTSIVDDPELQAMGTNLIDPDTTWYYGGSQGGIMGSVFMALSTDVTRGVLAVPGQPYNLLLERSVNFGQFADIINNTYDDHFDQQMLLHLTQTLWDRAEPGGFSRHVAREPLPGTPEHDVLMLVSIGDHQVSTLGAHVMARSLGAVNISPTNRTVWGVPEAEAAEPGPAMIEHDFGLPPEPLTNVPMTEGADPHGSLSGVPAAFEATEHFLRTGEARSFCEGPCSPD